MLFLCLYCTNQHVGLCGFSLCVCAVTGTQRVSDTFIFTDVSFGSIQMQKASFHCWNLDIADPKEACCRAPPSQLVPNVDPGFLFSKLGTQFLHPCSRKSLLDCVCLDLYPQTQTTRGENSMTKPSSKKMVLVTKGSVDQFQTRSTRTTNIKGSRWRGHPHSQQGEG